MKWTEHIGYLDGQGRSRIKEDLNQSRLQTSTDMLRMASSYAKQVHVGIVGAGFAGLRCADVLLRHGAKVTIFEARDRLGGRVAQSDLAGHKVDLGPNWIHGSNDNPIMRIAQETGTDLHSWEESAAVWDAAGQHLDPQDVGEFARLLWDDGVIADAFRYSNEHNHSIDPSRSLYDFFVEKSEGLFTQLPEELAKRRREEFLQFASIWGSYVGSPFTRQSLKFFWLEEVIEGENPFVAGTYHKILDAVALHARIKADIRLRAVVTGIQYRTVDDAARRPTLTTHDGESHEFDDIVVTSPLGWLKHNKAAFKPALDERIAQAINNIGYGTLDKVYVSFAKAFWQDGLPVEIHSDHGADTNGTTPNVTATTTPLHQPSSAEASHTGFFQWLAPIYPQEKNRWGQNGMNMAALSKGCAHPTILFYIFGDCSRYIADIVKSSPSKEVADRALTEYFKPYFSKLPHYDATSSACQSTGVLATTWANDEFAGYGSYTNFQIGLQNGDEDINAMRHGMPDQGLWFAGEHTAPFIAMGTTTGAYWSGEAVAKRIAEAYSLKEID